MLRGTITTSLNRKLSSFIFNKNTTGLFNRSKRNGQFTTTTTTNTKSINNRYIGNKQPQQQQRLYCNITTTTTLASTKNEIDTREIQNIIKSVQEEPTDGPLSLYNQMIKENKIKVDAHQLGTVKLLQNLYNQLKHHNFFISTSNSTGIEPNNRFSKLFSSIWGGSDVSLLPTNPNSQDASLIKGLYLHGDVGCGKTFLMDLFFNSIDIQKKKRIHFHHFMLDVHKRIHKWRQTKSADENDPIPPLSRQLVQEAWLLCFDEFQVTDVSDAMILKRLFSQMFDLGAVLVTTSNRPPMDLYKNGLNRQLFVPFIHFLESKCIVHNLNSGLDYRLSGTRGTQKVYLTPINDETTATLQQLFKQLTHDEPVEQKTLLLSTGRKVTVPRSSRNIAWFEFSELCEKALGADDYIEISKHYHTVFVSGVPKMNEATKNFARRFITLVDVLYEHKVKLLCTAEAAPGQLFMSDGNATEVGADIRQLTDDLTLTPEQLSRFTGEEERFMFSRAVFFGSFFKSNPTDKPLAPQKNSKKRREPDMNKDLAKILDNQEFDDIDEEDDNSSGDENNNNINNGDKMVVNDLPEGMCIECTDQPGDVFCNTCQESFCHMCCYFFHRTDKRKQHKFVITLEDTSDKEISYDQLEKITKNPGLGNAVTDNNNNKRLQEKHQQQQQQQQQQHQQHQQTTSRDDEHDHDQDIQDHDENIQDQHEDDEEQEESFIHKDDSFLSGARTLSADWFRERSKFIPIRLTLKERNDLRLLEAALHVSEYTDKIDIIHPTSGTKSKRINEQLRNICAILSGLLVASDFKKGQQLVENKDFSDNQEFFQNVFEIGRRHKIMNPAKMRTDYGKMIHLLQDGANEEVKRNLNGLNLIKPLKTVYLYLEERGGLGLLEDPNLEIATREILADNKARHEVQSEIRQKEKAIRYLAKKHSSNQLSTDEIELCIYSICDNHTYLRENRDPVKKMKVLLKKFFSPDHVDNPAFSLTLQPGINGARLSHNHRRQYNYVYQSLTLWHFILHDMFKLWYMAECDLLSENRYQLSNTGQGLNRIQQAPRVGRMMGGILRETQKKVGNEWIGSSVVHLGDHNVPNALVFIDKYTQISRILNPIVIVIEFIPKIKDPNILTYIQNAFGGRENLIKLILSDFFKHAFDGSGADNFFDAGSCIDGRLTSAWNWCSKIEKKSYYSIFLLAGFSGFDGSFN
ncbi:hypothetical protein CYY_003889 [Polysphondylium violaceum]|uniref:B box-type domain-containing protein n=1 Tax=Polysphondylium violaceum TaxID=133409 RepID=A0A8J4PX26_9MYCE|nr:hypothetical protein CYY_003889 [Polysphondylium violaceum]